MIPVAPVAEPPDFDSRVRQPGRRWSRSHPDERPRNYWKSFLTPLREGFSRRCGYSAMFVPVGTVDHFMPSRSHPELAYEWGNYRFAAEWINAVKGDAEGILDPFEIDEGWFEILLPSLQLVVTDRVPPGRRAMAERTLERLRLRDDERVIRQRREYLDIYESGELDLDGLRRFAPLLADAIERRDARPTGG